MRKVKGKGIFCSQLLFYPWNIKASFCSLSGRRKIKDALGFMIPSPTRLFSRFSKADVTISKFLLEEGW